MVDGLTTVRAGLEKYPEEHLLAYELLKPAPTVEKYQSGGIFDSVIPVVVGG